MPPPQPSLNIHVVAVSLLKENNSKTLDFALKTNLTDLDTLERCLDDSLALQKNIVDQIQQNSESCNFLVKTPLPKDINSLEMQLNNLMKEEDVVRVTKCLSRILQVEKAMKSHSHIEKDFLVDLEIKNFQLLTKSIIDIFDVQDKVIEASRDIKLIKGIFKMLIFLSSQLSLPNYIENCGCLLQTNLCRNLIQYFLCNSVHFLAPADAPVSDFSFTYYTSSLISNLFETQQNQKFISVEELLLLNKFLRKVQPIFIKPTHTLNSFMLDMKLLTDSIENILQALIYLTKKTETAPSILEAIIVSREPHFDNIFDILIDIVQGSDTISLKYKSLKIIKELFGVFEQKIATERFLAVLQQTVEIQSIQVMKKVIQIIYLLRSEHEDILAKTITRVLTLVLLKHIFTMTEIQMKHYFSIIQQLLSWFPKVAIPHVDSIMYMAYGSVIELKSVESLHSLRDQINSSHKILKKILNFVT